MIGNLILSWWWVGVLFPVILIFRQPFVKGKVGELFIGLWMKLMLDKTQYHIVNNVTIPDDKGGTTQIDHVVASRYGIFVVETKNMKGWIFGDTKSERWTQQIFKIKNTFQNPLRQNHKHIKSLAAMLNLADDFFIHVIAFVGECTLKTRDKLPQNVIKGGSGVVAYIKSHKDEILFDSEVESILFAIESGRKSRTFKTHREHVKHVKGIIADKARNEVQTAEQNIEPEIIENVEFQPVLVQDEPLCPQCGAAMVQRTATRGTNAGNLFWGCSRYPQCKAIVN